MGFRREQVAAIDLARQSQQIQSVAKESQNETRRLASAIDTLNGDRDRLYSRVSVLEQGLDSVTGAINRQKSAAPAQTPAAPTAATDPPQATAPKSVPAPVVAPVASVPSTPVDKPPAAAAAATVPDPVTVGSLSPAAPQTPPTPSAPPVESKPPAAPPDSAAAKPIEPTQPSATADTPAPEVVAAVPPAEAAESDAPPDDVAVQHTEFGIDVGSARSVGGLRALWRGLIKSNPALASLRPIITVKESNNGLGLQLRLVAGPLGDAATAAKICAVLVESKRACETTVFDGQRLAMQPEPAAIPAKPSPHRRTIGKRASNDDPPKKPDSSTFSSFFVRH
jgi:hypothetical protein